MTVLLLKVPMIRVLIVLAMISLVSAYPIGLAQTAENKGRGRSYPLIISHYSNVRNSKYDSPPATTEVTPTTTTAAAAAVITIKEESTDLKVDDIKESTSLVNTDEIQPTADAAADESKKSEEKKDDHVTTTAVPNMVTTDSAAAAAAIVSKNESISVATEAVAEDSLLVSKTTDEIQEKEQPTLTEAIKESASTGATNTNEEVPTTSSVEADKPAALGESAATTVASVVQVKTDESAQSVAAAADDSLATKEETVVSEDTVKPLTENDETVKVITELADQVKVSDVGTQEEVKAVTEAAVESSRTGSLATEKEKTSEFFEEDRSFKDRPEPELILAALRSSAAAAALAVGEESKTLPAQIDDITNEGIRLEREDNKKMAEKKEKEKEKYLLAKPSKEKKPTKTIQSNDPVQEYDDIITRAGKSKDDIESTTDTVVDKALTAEEPITLTLVPDNYPVILPSGESTLSDKVKPEDLEVKTVEEPITISLVPSNYPVVLPSGVSTLSDQVKPEDLKSSPTSEEPVTVSSVPSNYPVVLPSGESTLSDKVKTEVSESPKEVKTEEK
uniref:Uncharacterized protein n=1 Tax=Daphnia galeata TaxID=27404 RepID=A0A8J2WK80_9CRUS|nr:unnamed protein product [Daphnia galeata]